MTKTKNETAKKASEPVDERICQILFDKFETELRNELEGYYVWKLNERIWNDVSVKHIAGTEFKDEIDKEESIPRKTMIIKGKLKKHFDLNDEKSFLSFAHWIITKWGGILKSVNDGKLKRLREQLINDKPLEINSLSGISSLSKVAAFCDDSKYAVYDSRVAFTLNWLIFINRLHEKDQGKMKFFPQPASRNSDMKQHCQKDIFKRKYHHFSTKAFYYSEEDAYKVYCSLLKNTCAYCTAKSLWRNVTIGKLEMCLFSIAAKDKRFSASSIYSKNHSFITNEMDHALNDWVSKPGEVDASCRKAHG